MKGVAADMKKKMWIWNIVAAAGSLLLGFILGCVIFSMVQKEDAQKTDAQIYHENKKLSYAVENTNYAKGQIVFIGDSITDLYVLDDHYADLPLATYNRGIGGDTTEGVLNRLQVSAFDIQPAAIVLMIGTNDINMGEEHSAIVQRYGQIIDEIYAALPDVKLYCMSVIPQNEQIEAYSSLKVAQTTQKILALNQDIQILAQQRGATYLDLFSLLADENNRLMQAYSDDGLHLNSRGLSVWSELMKPYFWALSADEPC